MEEGSSIFKMLQVHPHESDLIVDLGVDGSIILEWIHQEIGVDLGSLGVTCSPRDPRFAGSNPTEVDGFYRIYKS